MENVLGIDSGISIHALLAESDYHANHPQRSAQ